MKTSRIFLTITMLALVILVFTGCQGVVPTPSPGATEDVTVISGRIKMPLTCCAPEGVYTESSDKDCDEAELWPFVPNAVVELKSAAKGKCKTVLATTLTDEDGNYLFEDVKPGLYIITAFCPEETKTSFFLKDVAEKIHGVALDAGIPDCTSTSLALVIEKVNNCYNDWYHCYNKLNTKVYKLIETIAKDVGKVDIVAIMNHNSFGDYCDDIYDDLVDLICDFGCCTSPGATGGGGGGPTPNPCAGHTAPYDVDLDNREATVGEVYTGTVTAKDDDDDVLSFAFAADPPEGMTIDSSTGVITWDSPTAKDVCYCYEPVAHSADLPKSAQQVESECEPIKIVVSDRCHSTPAEFCIQVQEAPKARLTIEKVVTAGGDTDTGFTFKITGPEFDPDGETFTLTGGMTITYPELTPGNYSVTETVPTNWEVAVSGDGTGSNPCSIALDSNDNKTITFTNTYEASAKLTVKKVVEGSHCPTDWSFDFQLKKGSTVEENFTLTNSTPSKEFTDLEIGTAYTVEEVNIPTGWSTTDSPQTVTLIDGDDETITFTNTYEASAVLIIKKVVESGVSSEFGIPYNVSTDTEFTFNIKGEGFISSGETFTLKNGQTKEYNNLILGKEYTISETDPGEFWSTTVKIGESGIETQSRSKKIPLAAGENIVIFTNTWCAQNSNNQHILITDSGLKNLVNAHPEGVLATMRLSSGSGNYPNSYFKVKLTTSTGSSTETESDRHGWCVTQDKTINTGRDYDVILLPLNSYTHHSSDKMKIVCGILDQASKGHDYYGNVGGQSKYTMTQVQNAIWIETNKITGTTKTERNLHEAGKKNPVSGCGIVAIPVTKCGTKAGRMSIFAVDDGTPVDKYK